MYCSATSVAATNQTQPIKQAHKIVLKSLPCLMSTLLLQCQVLLHVVRQAAKKRQTDFGFSCGLLVSAHKPQSLQSILDSFILSISELEKTSKLLLSQNNTENFLTKPALYKQAIFNSNSAKYKAAGYFDTEEEFKHHSRHFCFSSFIGNPANSSYQLPKEKEQL